jgi:hypothetical protein
MHHLHFAADQTPDGVDLSFLDANDLVDDASLNL